MVARSEETRSQEQARAKQELTDISEKHQQEVSNLQENVKLLVRSDFRILNSAQESEFDNLVFKEKFPMICRRRTSRRLERSSVKLEPRERKHSQVPYRNTQRSYRSSAVR